MFRTRWWSDSSCCDIASLSHDPYLGGLDGRQGRRRRCFSGGFAWTKCKRLTCNNQEWA
jgi:hypothetical protein